MVSPTTIVAADVADDDDDAGSKLQRKNVWLLRSQSIKKVRYSNMHGHEKQDHHQPHRDPYPHHRPIIYPTTP